MKKLTTAPEAGRTAPFSEAQRATLNRLSDLMIPASPDGRMPAASSLDLYGDVGVLSTRDRLLFEEGLAQIESRAHAMHGAPVTRLTDAAAMSLVDALRAEGSAFIPAFTVQTAGRYLMHETVMPLIGLPPRPHWPQGHEVEEGDWSLIDVVRLRPKFYREV